MRDKLHTLLGIKTGEELMVSMLLTQSIFLGIFIGSFDITAHSLLLSTFDVKIMARGYLVSGLGGIILTSLYSRFKTRFGFKNFSIVNFAAITAITVILWFALIYSPADWVIFLVFILLGPVNMFILYGLWGTADRLVTLKKPGSLSRLADNGLMTGILIISLALPILMSLKLQSHNILFISSFSVFIAFVFQIIIGNRFSLNSTDGKQHSEKFAERISILNVFREDSYIRTIIIFSSLAVLVLFFIQYSFMAVTREQYPAAEQMTGFLGLFTGIMMVFIITVKRVIFPYVLHNYGLRICLFISPVLIAVITAIGVIAGALLGYNTVEAGGFLIFFLLLALSRIISNTLRESIEFPSLNYICQPIDKKLLPVVISGMKGTVKETAVFFSGLVLTVLGLLSFIRLIHFSLFLIAIDLIWLLITIRLFREYKKSLITATEKAVSEGSSGEISDKEVHLENRLSGYLDFRTDYFKLISGDFSVLSKSRNNWYFEKIIDYAWSAKDINLLPVLKKTANNVSLDKEIQQRSAEMYDILQKASRNPEPDIDNISDAKKVLSGSRMPQTTKILRLLRDNSLESRRLAIYMIGKFHLSDLLAEVCDCLSVPGLTKDASEVLRSFGPEADKQLMRVALGTSGNIKLSILILRLLGRSGKKETLAFLFSRLWSNSRQIKEVVVKCLIDCRFTPTEEEKQRLLDLISEIIGSITWNLSAKIALTRDNDDFLIGKIDREIDRWNTFLFNILSITYNPGPVTMIRENIGKKTWESNNYALEMTNIVVYDSIKSKLITLLDFVPDEEKIKNLLQFYPIEIPIRKKLLEDIINRDYNLISLWTKACALRSIATIEYDDLTESVTALLFSPEELIREEAARLIARSNPGLYASASHRLSDSIKKHLDNIMNGVTDQKELLLDKVQFLSEHFGRIIEDDLLSLASELTYIKILDTNTLKAFREFIIWPLNSENKSDDVHVVYHEEIERFYWMYQDSPQLSFYLLPFIAVEKYHFQYPENSFDILKYIDKNED